jgi:hypothetical protein
LLAGVIALAFAPAEPALLGWGALGWGVAAVAGTWSGVRLVAVRGCDARGFLVTFFVLLAARLAAYAVGLVAAVLTGFAAVVAYLVGVGVAHATTQGFEWAWLARRTA